MYIAWVCDLTKYFVACLVLYTFRILVYAWRLLVFGEFLDNSFIRRSFKVKRLGFYVITSNLEQFIVQKNKILDWWTRKYSFSWHKPFLSFQLEPETTGSLIFLQCSCAYTLRDIVNLDIILYKHCDNSFENKNAHTKIQQLYVLFVSAAVQIL